MRALSVTGRNFVFFVKVLFLLGEAKCVVFIVCEKGDGGRDRNEIGRQK